MNQARQTMATIALKMREITKDKPDDKLTDKERQQLLDLDPIYTQAVESLHKSYDLACRLYLDGSVDRDRFRSQYERDVRKFFEEGRLLTRKCLEASRRPIRHSGPCTTSGSIRRYMRCPSRDWFKNPSTSCKP